MKELEHEQHENVGAIAFEWPNDQRPVNYPNKPYYGNQYVPHPTNAKAKVVHAEKVMEQVLKGK